MVLKLNMEINKELLSYLAGIIDGEGTITIRKSTYRIRVIKDCKNPMYSTRITLKMSVEEIPKLLKQTFNGHYYKEKKIYNGKNSFRTNCIMYCYEINNKSACDMLDKIYPYLIVKKKQAEIIFELKELKLNKEREKIVLKGCPPFTKDYIKKLDNLYLKIKKLNHPFNQPLNEVL